MPDVLDAEIVLGADLEAELLGVEHDLLTRQVLAVASDGASSSRAVTASVNGSLPSRPSLSCQRNSIFREPSIKAAGLDTAAADGGNAVWPSTCAVASSRLAVAVNVAWLPCTSETAPPRTSFVCGLGMPR